jgi:hypothetical protein
VSQRGHELDDVVGHHPVAVGEVLGVGFRRRGLAVASQVRTHDRVAGLDEQRGDLVPRRMRARMAVQQHDGRPASAVPDAQSDVLRHSHPV